MPINKNKSSQKGNIFAVLFGAVALTGVLAAVSMQTVTGPVRTVTKVTQKNMVDNDLMTANKIIVATAAAQSDDGDCDADGFVEPAPWRAAGGAPAPTGGGLLPNTIGANTIDPWGSEYGYCVWDHRTVDAAGCGGASQLRLQGPTAILSNQLVLAVVSAGPDKTFQTTCRDWLDANTDNEPDNPLIEKTAGSDDYIIKQTYIEAANTGGGQGLWNIKDADANVAEIGKDLEIKDSGGDVNVSISSATGVGDFLGITTDLIAAKTGGTIDIDGHATFSTGSNKRLQMNSGYIEFVDRTGSTKSGSINIFNDNINVDTAGGDIIIQNRGGGRNGTVGKIGIYGTDTSNQDGGPIEIIAGDASASGDGGDINITAGGSFGSRNINQTQRGGDVVITGGSNDDIQTGTGTRDAGSVYLRAGQNTASTDENGNVRLQYHDGAAYQDALFVDGGNGKVGIGLSNPSRKFHVLQELDAADANSLEAALIDLRSNTSVNGENAAVTSYLLNRKTVATGVTDTGFAIGNRVVARRNGYLASTDDNGILDRLFGEYILYGHGDINPAATPHTNLIRGLSIVSQAETGTIDSAYDIHLATTSGGPTATQHWGIHQATPGIMNYFAGNIGIGAGAAEPIFNLHIDGNAGEEGTPGIFIEDPTTSAGTHGGRLYFDDTSGQNVFKMASRSAGSETGYIAIDRDSGDIDFSGSMIFDQGNGDIGVGPDIHFDASGMLAAEDHMYFNIDSGNLNTNRRFEFRTNTSTSSGGSLLMRLNDTGILTVYGSGTTCTIGNGVGATNCTSDMRLKKDVHTLENSLDTIMNSRGVRYKWNELAGKDKDDEMIGVIAQEVQEILPEIVSENEDTGYLQVGLDGYIPVLIEAVKELKHENDALKADNKALEKRLKAIEEKLAE
jgi:hypothetical protein